VTVTFGPEYFFARRKSDNHPVPHGGKIRATVRKALLTPERLHTASRASTVERSC